MTCPYWQYRTLDKWFFTRSRTTRPCLSGRVVAYCLGKPRKKVLRGEGGVSRGGGTKVLCGLSTKKELFFAASLNGWGKLGIYCVQYAIKEPHKNHHLTNKHSLTNKKRFKSLQQGDWKVLKYRLAIPNHSFFFNTKYIYILPHRCIIFKGKGPIRISSNIGPLRLSKIFFLRNFVEFRNFIINKIVWNP